MWCFLFALVLTTVIIIRIEKKYFPTIYIKCSFNGIFILDVLLIIIITTGKSNRFRTTPKDSKPRVMEFNLGDSPVTSHSWNANRTRKSHLINQFVVANVDDYF